MKNPNGSVDKRIATLVRKLHKQNTYFHFTPERNAQWTDFPEALDPRLSALLDYQGIRKLYSHQRQAFDSIHQGNHTVIVTGVASGKTLCYNLPVANTLLKDQQARALYLFPTKALAQDQRKQFEQIIPQMTDLSIGIYDGDTPKDHRKPIRENARVVITNPDMLHTGVLPHHTRWKHLMRSLRYIVIDEIHSYRGIFGSHVANVIRRLKRIAAFYGAKPIFIMTSATISNPEEHAKNLIEEPVHTILEDGAGRGAKYFILYNPPIVNKQLGIRRSSMQEAIRLNLDVIENGLQSIVFTISRKSVELILRYLRDSGIVSSDRIRGYRSGYLPRQRRKIEEDLQSGFIRSVVATSALEAGIDIGHLDVALINGYPGSIASTWQQAGRAGRRDRVSLAVLVLAARPIDQFLASHPEYFFGRSPESCLINANHLFILFQHIQCAAFELPFRSGESFGSVPHDEVNDILQILQEQGVLHQSGERWFWMDERYPSEGVSLRSSSPQTFTLQLDTEDDTVKVIGKIDYNSAFWLTHPQAVYFHEGQSYLVGKLDLDSAIVKLREMETDYYTDAMSDTEVQPEGIELENNAGKYLIYYGNLQVTRTVTGFRKLKFQTNEVLGYGEVKLPPTDLHTCGFWFGLPDETVDHFRETGIWGSDPNQYGPFWESIKKTIRKRDGYKCQHCGKEEGERALDVHHIIPFRACPNPDIANLPENLVTLCPSCHRIAEFNVYIQSGLNGLTHVLRHLSPLYLMCDYTDLGVLSQIRSPLTGGKPAIIVYDAAGGGIGLSRKLYDIHRDLLANALDLIENCTCDEGCPSCVGPAPLKGSSGKQETMEILRYLLKKL